MGKAVGQAVDLKAVGVTSVIIKGICSNMLDNFEVLFKHLHAAMVIGKLFYT